jgi:hypothetical protein
VAKKEIVNRFNAQSVRQQFAALLLALVLMVLSAEAETNSVIAASTNAPSAVANVLPAFVHAGNVTDIDEEPSSDGKKHVHVVIKDDGNSFGDLAIPLAGIIGVFGMPVAIVLVAFYFNFRRRRETLVTVREYLNKGLPVPPELLTSMSSGDSSTQINARTGGGGDLRRGFKLTFIGLGVALALYFNDTHSTTWCWGLIPAVMGVGYLLSGWTQGNRQPAERETNLPPKP